jgi:hypothetical protein
MIALHPEVPNLIAVEMVFSVCEGLDHLKVHNALLAQLCKTPTVGISTILDCASQAKLLSRPLLG